MPHDHPYRTPPLANDHVLRLEVSIRFAVEQPVAAMNAFDAQAAADEIANRAARILDHSGFPMVPHWMSSDQPRAGASAECKIDGRAVAVFPADERCIECGGPVIHQPVDDKDAGTRVLFGADYRAVVHNRCRRPLTPADRAAILETASAPYGPRFDGESLLIIFRRYEETIAALERKVGK